MAKYLDQNGLLYFWTKIKATFVAKEAGKGLSANDLSNTLKTNYDAAYTHSTSGHAPTDAEKNVQADWNVSDSGSDAFIKNKPTIPAAVTVDAALSSSSTNAIQNQAVYAALGNKLDLNTKGQANGLASLDANGLVPSNQLPSYVDDVIELLSCVTAAPATCSSGDRYYNITAAKIYTATATNTWGATGVTPSSGVIYVDLATNATYRWSGSTMVVITTSDVVAITNAEIDVIVAS